MKVAVQEQMNIREGRPSSFVGSRDVRAPAVINDRFLQQVFSVTMPGGRSVTRSMPGPTPRGITGILSYIFNMVFQYCYSTISSILSVFLGGNEERSKRIYKLVHFCFFYLHIFKFLLFQLLQIP